MSCLLWVFLFSSLSLPAPKNALFSVCHPPFFKFHLKPSICLGFKSLKMFLCAVSSLYFLTNLNDFVWYFLLLDFLSNLLTSYTAQVFHPSSHFQYTFISTIFPHQPTYKTTYLIQLVVTQCETFSIHMWYLLAAASNYAICWKAELLKYWSQCYNQTS